LNFIISFIENYLVIKDTPIKFEALSVFGKDKTPEIASLKRLRVSDKNRIKVSISISQVLFYKTKYWIFTKIYSN
jgi:hypothetical protein